MDEADWKADRKDFFGTVLQASMDGFFVVDMQGRLRDVNPAYCRMVGYSREELLGMNLAELEVDETPEETREHMAELVREGRGRFQTRHRARDGRSVPVEASTVYMADPSGEGGSFVTFIRDMTQQEANEAALRQAKEAAEQASRVQQQFLDHMSHEIKTPMNAIMGYAEILQGRLEELSPGADEAGFAGKILESGQVLLGIINDILELSRLDRIEKSQVTGRLSPLDRPLNVLQRFYAGEAAKKGLDFSLELDDKIPESLYLDDKVVRQVLFNLVGNAVKFTDSGWVRICFAVSGAPRTEKGGLTVRDYELRVEDSGAGIPSEEMEAVTKPFQQGSLGRMRYGAAESAPGTGLGLTIVKRLVDRMGGDLTLESTPGKGTRVRVVLRKIASEPDARTLREVMAEGLTSDGSGLRGKEPGMQGGSPQESPAAQGEASQEGALQGFSLVTADDDGTNRMFLKTLLEEAGARVLEASDGAGAVDLVRDAAEGGAGTGFSGNLPEGVLLDLRMPGIGGAGAARRIRQFCADRKIPSPMIFALSGASRVSNGGEESLFDGFIPKPFDRKTLLDHLEGLNPLKGMSRGEDGSGRDAGGQRAVLRRMAEDCPAVFADLQQALLPVMHRMKKVFSPQAVEEAAAGLETAAERCGGEIETGLRRLAEEFRSRSLAFDIAGLQRLAGMLEAEMNPPD